MGVQSHFRAKMVGNFSAHPLHPQETVFLNHTFHGPPKPSDGLKLLSSPRLDPSRLSSPFVALCS